MLITNGAQQALDLIARAVIDDGDVAVVESPAYLGATQVLRTVGASITAVASDDDGIDTRRAWATWSPAGCGPSSSTWCPTSTIRPESRSARRDGANSPRSRRESEPSSSTTTRTVSCDSTDRPCPRSPLRNWSASAPCRRCSRPACGSVGWSVRRGSSMRACASSKRPICTRPR